MKGVCLAFALKPRRATDPQDMYKKVGLVLLAQDVPVNQLCSKVEDWWTPGQQFLKSQSLDELIYFDTSTMAVGTKNEVRAPPPVCSNGASSRNEKVLTYIGENIESLEVEDMEVEMFYALHALRQWLLSLHLRLKVSILHAMKRN